MYSGGNFVEETQVYHTFTLMRPMSLSSLMLFHARSFQAFAAIDPGVPGCQRSPFSSGGPCLRVPLYHQGILWDLQVPGVQSSLGYPARPWLLCDHHGRHDRRGLVPRAYHHNNKLKVSGLELYKNRIGITDLSLRLTKLQEAFPGCSALKKMQFSYCFWESKFRILRNFT